MDPKTSSSTPTDPAPKVAHGGSGQATGQTQQATSQTNPRPPLASSTPIAPPKIQVRLRTESLVLTASQIEQAGPIRILSGQTLHAFPGDWVIAGPNGPIDVVADMRFKLHYEEVGEPLLAITGPDRTVLEAKLGFGSTRDSATLTKAVSRLAILKIGNIEKQFSVSQWEELNHRASKRNLTLSAYLDQVIEKLLQDLWTNI